MDLNSSKFRSYEKISETTDDWKSIPKKWLKESKKNSKKGGKFSAAAQKFGIRHVEEMEIKKNLQEVNKLYEEMKFRDIRDPNCLWIATEKVHGANFCFVQQFERAQNCVKEKEEQVEFEERMGLEDGGRTFIKPAKRSGFIEEKDSFFGFEKAFLRYLPQIEKLCELVRERNKTKELVSLRDLYGDVEMAGKGDNDVFIERIWVYGELFGGYYPPFDKNGKAIDFKSLNSSEEEEAVQKEISYSPSLEFYFFDIAVEIKSASLNTSKLVKRYIDYVEMVNLFASTLEFKLFSVPLFVGSLSEALQFDLNFNSIIPSFLGLPIIESNVAEGIVIRSTKEVSVETHKGRKRGIVKKKHPKFAEKVRNVLSHSLDRTCQPLFNLISPFINKNRFFAVLSKIGNDTNMNELKVKLFEDALEACELENPGFKDLMKSENINKSSKKQLIFTIENFCADCIKENWSIKKKKKCMRTAQVHLSNIWVS